MSSNTEQQTERVFAHHAQATMAKDLDALMEDYTEDSVVITNTFPAPLKGLTAIREALAQVVAAFTPELLSSMKIDKQVIEGEIAYVVASVGPAGPYLTDTYVIRDGKILVETSTTLAGHGS